MQIKHSVHYLNDDVFNAVKQVKNPQAPTVEDALAIKEAILKDGKIDAGEQDLLNELIVRGEEGFISWMREITGANAEEAQIVDVYGRGSATADAEKMQIAQFSKEAADALDISLGDQLARQTQLSLEFINDEVIQPGIQLAKDGVDGIKRMFNHIWQYDSSQGTKKENQANCGPASAHIVGENLGLDMPKLSEIRSMVGGRRGSGRGAFALSVPQVIRAVEKQGAKEGVEIKGDSLTLSSTRVDPALDHMREALDKGEQVILLTSNIAIQSRGQLNSGRGKGHYVVVNEVKPDGSIVISDPQKRGGEPITHSREHLQTHLQRRRRFGRPNVIMTFAKSAVS